MPAANQMQAKTVITAVFILMLLAGVTIGFMLGDRHGAVNPAGLTAPLSTNSAYENSLRGYVALLDNLSARDASDAARQIHAADKALLLIRLADLAEQRGSSAESTRLAANALAVCSTAALAYCSSVELRQRAQAIDGVLERMQQVK